VTLRVGANALTLVFPRGWLEARPLTRADLEEEAELFAGVGFRLRFPAASRAQTPGRKARRR
jgi:exopolyphosphatase/guanosine-5'-triphosphate,3'-diphosphate pyrophosphatase